MCSAVQHGSPVSLAKQTHAGSVCPGDCHLFSSPGVSLLNLFRQLCLLRDFRIIWEGESKDLFAGLSQSESTTEVQIKDLIFNYVEGGMGSPGVKSDRWLRAGSPGCPLAASWCAACRVDTGLLF